GPLRIHFDPSQKQICCPDACACARKFSPIGGLRVSGAGGGVWPCALCVPSATAAKPTAPRTMPPSARSKLLELCHMSLPVVEIAAKIEAYQRAQARARLR